MTEINKEQDDLRIKLDECTQKCEEYLNNWKRAAADLINYKKDEGKRLEEIVKFANENVVLELVGLFDEVILALSYAPEGVHMDGKWLEGTNNLMKKFSELIERHGVKRIETIGEKFDPLLHEAISQEKSDKESGIILEEIRAGYIMNGKVIRAARVMVAE